MGIATYKVEPYVVSADVYSVAPHVGRGGWSWYTGSAGWMYRLLIETLLGANLEGDRLRLLPRMPLAWTTFKLHYRYRNTHYHITISRISSSPPQGVSLSLDGEEQPGGTFPLSDDNREHSVVMRIR